MDIATINNMGSAYLPFLQWLIRLTVLLVLGTIAAAIVVHKRTEKQLMETWVFKAVIIAGIGLSLASAVAVAVVGVADENALNTVQQHSFEKAAMDTYGAAVEPGVTLNDVSHQIASSNNSSAKADFLIEDKPTTLTVKQVAGKWLLFDDSGDELPRVRKV